MSIFKRGKHAKDEEPGSRYGNGTPPSSSYGSVSLSPESIEKIAEGTRLYLAPADTEAPVTVGEVGGEGWTEVTEYAAPDGYNPEDVYNPEDEQILSFYQSEDVAFPKDFNAQEWVDERLEEVGVNPFELELDRVLVEIKELLLEKNASYGDSALNPVRIMSDADAAEQIRIRMDDKLSRLYRGFAFEDTETGNPEDTLKDLVGYYFLLKIAEARNAQS